MYLRFDFQCFHRLGSRDSSKGRTYMHGISFYENVLSNKLFDHFLKLFYSVILLRSVLSLRAITVHH